MSDKCVRCGEVDEDCRTLRMACFYAMSELNIPFKQSAIHGQYCIQTGTEKSTVFKNHDYPVFKDPDPDTENKHFDFFTLRVCKDCRSSWMTAIEEWFNSTDNKESCGSGIFVRKNGTNVEITEEEWHERSGGIEPVRLEDDPV